MNLFEKDVLTTGEVAKICNVASRTVSKWFDSGQLRGYRIPGSKDRRIPVSNLVKFMKGHGIPMDGLMSGSTRVLIVDGDEDVINTLTKVLSEQTNYEVHSATSAFEAGVECERFRPHVMLLDIHISDTEGRDVCKVLRASDDLQVTKIIGMRLAKAIRPKPSSNGLRPRITVASPTPSAVTRGTVMVEVVTPPES